MMPPEDQYRPRNNHASSVLGAFFFVFGTVFAMLWFTTSMWPVFLLVAVYFARTFFNRASHGSAVRQNQNAVNLLNAGHVEEAAQIFDRLTRTERRTSAHAVYVFNRAVAYVLQGRPRRAYSLFNAVQKSRAFSFGFSNMYLPLLYVEMGTCLALLGHLEQAHRYRQEAYQSLDSDERGRVMFLDAVLFARGGQSGAVVQSLHGRDQEAEAMLRVPTRRALRVVEAFALRRLGEGGSSRFRTLVEGARSRPGEYRWVGAEWPEFRDFLREQGL